VKLARHGTVNAHVNAAWVMNWGELLAGILKLKRPVPNTTRGWVV